MLVRLIAHTIVVNNVPGYIPHEIPPTYVDDLGEQAGRLCYLSWNRPNPERQTNEDYLDHILDVGHESITEHGSATFYIDGVTRALLLELERHRHFSYSVVSQRYVDAARFKLIEHPELAKLSNQLKARIASHEARSLKLYQDIVKELEELGDSRKTARGAARTILPEGTETRILITGNLRAFRDMLWKRLSESADSEIRQLARLLLAELKTIAPNTFQDFEDLAA